MTRNNLYRGLAGDDRQVQADLRTHLIRRPARDIIPPLGGVRVSSYCASRVSLQVIQAGPAHSAIDARWIQFERRG
jgi:hypothetical protein